MDYTYIAGRLNAMESELPERSWYERLARSETGSLLQSAREYFPGFEEIDSIYRFAEALEMEKLNFLELLSGILRDEEVVRFLRAEYDFDNLILYWKGEFLDSEVAEDRYARCGLTSEEIISEAVRNGSGVYLPVYLKDSFDHLLSVTDRSGLDAAQLMLERSKYDYLLEASPSDFARHYTRMRIDTHNIRNFIRTKRTGLLDQEQERWIPGGFIDILTLRALFHEPEDELYSYLSYSRYSRLIDGGLDSSTPLWKVEPALSWEIYYYLAGRRHSFFDITPVIFHLENMNRSYSALRSIITGVINRLPEEIIMEILDGVIPS
ncbi:MAG: hypothetical protein GF417_00215 [Candidatus Latescibacteria bacterium]|nr:hypothetical protein [bacterium]MBD3422851.1 hypothetical protein [Candidatus Latescibacterota bacterium]